MKKTLIMAALAAVAVGLSFGEDKAPVSTFTDKRDGKVYRIVEINGQVWMAENLNYAAKGSVCYGEGGKSILVYDEDDNPSGTIFSDTEVQAHCAKYGRLYDWNTAMTACPAGTHLPSDKEWTRMMEFIGGESKAGTKLKSSTGWKSDKDVPAGSDDFGWSALPGGLGDWYGYFYNAGNIGYWWSTTEKNANLAWSRYMEYNYEYMDIIIIIKTDLLSVRCVQDDGKEKRR